MMRSIPETVWRAHFKQPDGRYDGYKFERLVGDLLQEMYPYEWMPTPKSHDKARDFVAVGADGELWAECKSYEKNMSLHILSPTLVMALIERVKGILIFSRSRLNDNAVVTVARYRTASQKQIQVFDGETLDELVLKHPKLFRAYFPGHQELRGSRQTVDSWVYYNKDPLLVISRDQLPDPKTEDEPIKLKLFDTFGLSTVVKNTSPETATVIVSLNPNQLPACVEPLGANRDKLEWNLRLPGGGLEVVTIYFRAAGSTPLAQLPDVVVTVGSSTKTHRVQKIKITGLYRTALVGVSANRGLTKFTSSVSHRRRALVYCLTGRSGVGKSRLLREFGKVAVEAAATTQLFDSELQRSTSSDTFVRQFLANLADLPLFQAKYERDRFRQLKLATTASTKDVELIEYLYDTSRRIDPHDLASLVLQIAGKRRVCWLIDNAQNLDSSLVAFFNALIELLENYPSPFTLVLCFNTDLLVPGSQWSALAKDLEFAARSEDGLCSWHLLEEFDRLDAERFLSEALTGWTDSRHLAHYRHTMDLFFQFVEPRPLHIWQTLMYLEDQRVLTAKSDRLTITDPEAFRREIARLPPTLERLLEKRFAALVERLQKSDIGPDALNTALEIMYILGSASETRLIQFGASLRCVEILAQSGFLEWESSGTYRFYHFRVILFVRDRRVRFEISSAATYLQKIREHNLEKKLYQTVLILSEVVGFISSQVGRLCLNEFLVHGASLIHGFRFCRILQDWLLHRAETSAKTITALQRIAGWLNEHLDYQSSESSYRESFRLLAAKRLGGVTALAFCRMLHAMSNCLLAIGEDEDALEVVSEALRRLEELSRKNSDDLSLIGLKGHLLNRRMAIHKAVGAYDAAIADGQLALEVASVAADLELRVLNSLDIGRIYYEAYGDDELLVMWWKRGVAQYSEITDLKDRQIYTRTTYVRAMLKNIEGDTAAAKRTATEGIAYAEATKGHFWGIRLHEAALCAYLLEGSLGQDVEQLHTSLVDWWTAFGVKRSAWRVHYLKAKIQYGQKSHRLAATSFIDTLESLAQVASTPEKSWRKRHLYHDIALCIASQEIDMQLPKYLLPVNSRLRKEMLEILRMDQDDLKHAIEEHVGRTLLRNVDLKVSLPVL